MRVLTGNKAGTILAMSEAPTLNVTVTGSTQNWTAWTGLFNGATEDFVTAFSGTFTPAESGSYNFHWNNDDAGMMYIDMNGNGAFDNSERVANYGWNMNGNKTLTASTPYSIIYMAHEFGGGENVWWAYTPPSGGERIVNPSDATQAGMWSTDVPPARFGNLTMGSNARLILGGSGLAGFTSITSGPGAQITGDVIVDQTLSPSGLLTVDGDLTLASGSVYEWHITPTPQDLVDVLDALRLDGTFTLRLFAAGGSIDPNDPRIPILHYGDEGLFINGLPFDPDTNPLQYLIEIGNLDDPLNVYRWDICDTRLVVDGNTIYIDGLLAAAIPEPTTLVLLGLGAFALARRRRRQA